VSLDEALERLLPYCEGNPFEVARWLDLRQRAGKIRLLGDDDAMAPNAAPPMLGVMARVPPDGRASLYVEVRRHLGREYRTWTFERASFEDHFPTPTNRGGRPREFTTEDLLIEALVYAGVVGGLPKTVEGEGSLFEKLKSRL
jgi:hypothetical protein